MKSRNILIDVMLMKKNVTAATLLGLLLSFPVQAATLKIATLSPDGSYWMRTMKAAAEQVSGETDKRVKFRFYPGGVMGNDQAVMKKIRIGQLHGAMFPGGALAAKAPDSQVYNVPMLFQSYAEVDYVRQRLDAELEALFAEAGFKSFGLAEGGFGYIMSRQSIESPEDLQRARAWVPTEDVASQSAVDSFGIAPVALSLSDVLTGLQTGLIDTVAASPIAAIALQWHTQVNYVLDMPIVYLYGVLAIDRKAWKKISEEDQAVIDRVMRAAFRKMDAQNRIDNESAFSALQNQNIKRLQPSPDQFVDWQTRGEAAAANFIERGGINPALIKRVNELLTSFRAGQ